jgi:hypothetical protein
MMTSSASIPVDNRLATRYEPMQRDACLSWGESVLGTLIDPETGTTERSGSSDPVVQSQFALLLDISHTGARIALDRVPRQGKGVRLGLEGIPLSDWTDAEVVDVTSTTRGPHVLRLAFRSPCPFETLEAAVCG